MKCLSCGAESQGKFCEYCGSEMPQEKTVVIITNHYYGYAVPENAADNTSIGAGQNCGYAQNPNANNKATGSKKKTWLWVLGWIFIFPVPLTILLLRKKNMKPVPKYGIIAAAWILFLVIGLSGNSEGDVTPSDLTSPTGSTLTEQTTNNQTDVTNSNTDAKTDTYMTWYPDDTGIAAQQETEAWNPAP